ncbi:hypothetical protein K2X14_04770 [Acetobacter sp. TBRC 12305]|uniref:Uncharacterized protein n=1 Tax=Acetobacter garciniae TaxID=2817435 RepID=A0A939HJ95_9PROT|nr:hypothetical protein [Acetobacter garciniae]MBO1324467.1 hypothetical protein [Acetobacter garciniae]MBX0344156.1 hypothetical protein [Acetobacter garciniae]
MNAILAENPMIRDAASRTIGAVRHALHGPRRCDLASQRATAWENDLAAISPLFRTAQETMLILQGAGLILAPPGTVRITRHERRLLRATAAAQDEEDMLMDNVLYKLAPHPQARPALARAVTVLANSLAGCGHWLSAPPLPAGALGMMRMRRVDLARVRVAWPVSERRRSRYSDNATEGMQP